MKHKTEETTLRPKSKIYIVDDHPLYRESLAQLINRENDMQVCGHCGGAEEALKEIERLKPDLVTIDISLKDSNGLDLIKSIKARHNGIAIVALSMFDETLYAERILHVGARGYIMKEEEAGAIVSAIRRVMDGKVHLSEAMNERMLVKKAEGVPENVPSIETLSDRELEVFQFIGEGVASSQIAKRLRLSVKTVETYRANIKTKLHLRNNMELIRHAVQWVENGKTH